MTDPTLSFPQAASGELEATLQSRYSLALATEARTAFCEGMKRLQAAEPGQALEFFSRTVELAPAFPEARICLGLAYALTHNIYPAMDQLERAGELDPESFAARYTLAKLNFKLRIPQKGYEAARQALQCVTTIEQRRMLTDMLKEERARERNGIARPWFNKPFSRIGLALTGGSFAAAILALLLYVRW
ncbi:MAG TPA: CDC27 family protein [Terriglobales bacterium]|jgi:tetratricopeptide (TPR) repeat protein